MKRIRLFCLMAMILACGIMTAQNCSEPVTTAVPFNMADKHGRVIGQGTYRHGAMACIEAVPDEGYVFAGWSDGSMENPREFMVMYDLQASFKKAPEKTKESVLEVYTNHLTLFVSGYNGENYEIFTMTGLKIYHGHDTEVQLPMSGVYLIRTNKKVFKVLATE